jgi:hypothetical protein
MFGGSIARSSSSFDISMVNQRYMGRRLYTKFGQGCQYVWRTANTRTELITRNVYLAPIFRNDGVDIAIFTLQNEILSLFDVIFLTDDARYGWITIDPISRCLFFCPSYDVSLSSEARFFSIYNIVPLDNGRLTFTELNSAMVNSPITNCTGGCFSDNGILYLLNNDDDNTGFSAYTFNYNQYLPGYVFNKVKDYRVYTPDESIWSSDNQDLVGIGYFSFSNQSRFLGILHRNEDIGDDNISYTTVRGLM